MKFAFNGFFRVNSVSPKHLLFKFDAYYDNINIEKKYLPLETECISVDGVTL